MDDLPKLPEGYRWRAIEQYKAIVEHIESRKSHGIRSFGPEGLAKRLGLRNEIAYGLTKIERELQRDREYASGIK